jgi:hypothetical protein
MPSSFMAAAHSAEVNCTPLSDVIMVGRSKRATQLHTKASATSAVAVARRGMASSHLVVLSTIVRRYAKPS